MRHALWLFMLCCSLTVAAVNNPPDFPKGALGLQQVDCLIRGELLWMQGRVGEGTYTTTDAEGRHCAIRVPVVVGKVASSGLGIDSAAGLAIVVMTPRLDAALSKGERVNSRDFIFSREAADPAADGYIVSGIAADEGFVLNSRRRWIAWLLEDKPALRCQ